MTDEPRPGDDPPTIWGPPVPIQGSTLHESGSLTTTIRALQLEERRRRRLRTAALFVAAGITVIGLGVLVAAIAIRSSTDNTETTSPSSETSLSFTTSTKPPATTGKPTTSTTVQSTASGAPTQTTGTRTTAKPAYATKVKCDTAAIATALLDAPEPYEFDGTSKCSKAFWAVPVVVPSDEEKLTVVFKVGPDRPEAIAVKKRDACSDVATDDPTFDPGLCPS